MTGQSQAKLRSLMGSRAGPARRTSRGAALVEAAIAVPLLFTMLFGIIDFGGVFNDFLSVRQGTREGARQAAVTTTPTPAAGCQTTGIATSGDGYDLVCYVKDRMGLDQSKARVSIWFDNTAGALPTASTVANPYPSGNAVVICTQYPAQSISGFLSPFITGHLLTSKVEIRIEQTSTTFAAPVAETAYTSGGLFPATCRQA